MKIGWSYGGTLLLDTETILQQIASVKSFCCLGGMFSLITFFEDVIQKKKKIKKIPPPINQIVWESHGHFVLLVASLIKLKQKEYGGSHQTG